MKIDKSFTIDAPQDRVWQYVSSPEKVGLCFPGCQEIESLGDDKYLAAIKVQMGPIRTVFKVNFEVTEQRPPDYAAYSSRGEEVQIGLGAVLSDEDLAVLERVHRPGIDVQVRVELLHHYPQSAGGQEVTETSRGEPLAQG